MLSMLPCGCGETLAFGTLLHDVAKPRCRAVVDGKTNFYGHTEQGAAMAGEIMRRLRRSRFVQERVAYLVRYHLRMCMAPRMRPATLKRMLAEEGFPELLELSRLDALGSSSYLGFYHFCRHAMAAMAEHEIRPPRLIGGDDLIRLGFRPGPQFKQILAEIDDLHLDGLLTTPGDALNYVLTNYRPAVPDDDT
jgi:putative nucleotidyltransferase with HDIG domain